MLKTGPNRTFFMDFGTFSKFDEKWVFWTSMRKNVSVRKFAHKYRISGVNFVKYHQKNAPKSMKNVWFGSGFLHLILTLIHQQYYVLTTLTTFVREISSKSSYFYGLVIGSWLFLTYFKQYFDTIIMMVVPSCLKEMNTSTLAKKSLKYVFEVNYGDCSNWRHMTPSFYLTSLFIWRPLDVIKSRWIKLIYLVLRTSHTSFIYHL